MCIARAAWAIGRCRTCERPDDRLGERLGIPSGVFLDVDRCPSCGVTWPTADECHVCGGPASPGEYWEDLDGLPAPPEEMVAALVESALHWAEVEPSEGHIPRAELDRLMTALYGRADLAWTRASWRFLGGAYLRGSADGARLWSEEMSAKAREESTRAD